MSSLLFNRDRLLMQLMHLLPSLPGLTESDQGRFFSATMFPNVEVTLRFPRPSGSRWEKYLALRDAVIPVEEFFATQYLSKELLEVLHSEVQTRRYRSTAHKAVCHILQAVEIRCLLSGDPTASMYFEHDALFDIVNSIRNHPEEFPEWHASATAQLYYPAIFENKKDSLGYWF